MEGLVSQIIVENDQFARELYRDCMHIEVPYLEKVYRQWMKIKDGKSDNVINTYISFIKTVDKHIFLCDSEEDFFELLAKKTIDRDFHGIINLFDEHLSFIDDWLEDSKKEDFGISTKTIRDWRSGFKNYKKFFTNWVIPKLQKKLNIKENVIMQAPDCKILFAEEDFRKWLVENSNFGEGSIDSYVSRLKRLNKVLSEQFSNFMERPTDAFDTYLVQNIQEGKWTLVQNFFFHVINTLNQKIEQKNDSLMPIDALRNCNSALRKYSKFILEEFVVDIPDEEEIYEDIEEEEIKLEDKNDFNNSNNIIQAYDYEMIESIFEFRLVTQNRIGKNKDVFFPIGLIRKLFRTSEKKSKDNGENNGYYKWLNKWVRNCIAEIIIITDKGNTTLGLLNEDSALIINPETKDVFINMIDKKEIKQVLTNTDKEGEAPVPMKVTSREEIHIDHTPLMSQILSDNISKLPALVRLTDIIRTTAHEHNIEITTKNFNDISNKVIENADTFAEMEKLIPALKEELELIRESSTLQLMSQEYNLRKKK